MKRFFFSLIALSAAVVGCTQSALLETPEQFGTEITFSPYTGRTPVTKAQSIEGEGGVNGVYGLAEAEGFHILGFLNETTVYMNGQVQSVDGVWTYGEGAGDAWEKVSMYWPDTSSESTLSFVAYSENALGTYTSADGTSKNIISWTKENEIFEFTVPNYVNEQIDLLATAYQPGLLLKDNPSGIVSLNFYHLLSRVGFKVQSTSSSNTVTVTDLTLTGIIPTKGTLDLNDISGDQKPALEIEEGEESITYDCITGATGPVGNTASRVPGSEYLMIIPHSMEAGSDYEIEVTYTVGSNPNPRTTKATISGYTFAPGKAYEFILKISTSAIKFQVDIQESDWENPQTIHTEDALYAEVNALSSTTAVIDLIAKESNLGTIGIQYKSGSNSWTTEPATTNTVELSNLTPNTVYTYRPYSTKDGQTKTYSERTFKTKALEIAFALNEIHHDRLSVTATLANNIDAEEIDEAGFCLVPGTGMPTLNDNRKVVTLDSSTEFTTEFTNLYALTEYSCCAYVIIDNETYFSANKTFTTAPTPSTVVPDAVEMSTFTIKATPSTATILLESSDSNNEPVEKHGTGTASITVPIGKTVAYTVSDGDNVVTGSIYLEYSYHHIEVTLEENGNNVETAPDAPPAAGWEEVEGEDENEDGIPDNETII